MEKRGVILILGIQIDDGHGWLDSICHVLLRSGSRDQFYLFIHRNINRILVSLIMTCLVVKIWFSVFVVAI